MHSKNPHSGPSLYTTDLGTANGLVASMQCLLIDICFPQEIKELKDGGVSFVRIGHHGGVSFGVSFSYVLQKECDHRREHWNTHRIRKSRHGAPTILWTLSCAEFHWPEFHDLTNNTTELSDSQRH